MQGLPQLTVDTPADIAAGAAISAPLIAGKALYLWTGAGAVLFVAVLLFVLLGRWRAGQKAEYSERKTEFFQPAGEDAEITFDETGPQIGLTGAEENSNQFAQSKSEPKPNKTSPFSGLFRSHDRRNRDEDSAPELLDLGAENTDLASVNIDRPHLSEIRNEPAQRAQTADWAAIEREARRREGEGEEAGRAALEERRRQEEIEAEAQARWRAVEEDRRQRLADEDRRRAEREAAAAMAGATESRRFADETVPHAAHDEIVRTLSEVEEALQVQREAIQAETRSLLDAFARRFDERLDALAQSVERRSIQPAANAKERGHGEDRAFLNEIAHRLDDHRNEVSKALNAFARRLDNLQAPMAETRSLREEIAELRKSFNGAAAPSAPAVQLADIVSNALAPGAYEFNAMLANNRRADCLIRLARPPGPIAIDAQFPVESFHALHERRSTAAEDEFRRIALRHIVQVAERLISPGFTADSALLFLPSESMASDLHTRFPDLIQDSYRARVWIVSPTTLMATLHTLSAFLRDTPRREPAVAAEEVARRALSEVERLSARIAAIEQGPAQEMQELRETRPLAYANDASAWRPDRESGTEKSAPISPPQAGVEEPGGDLYSEEEAAAESRRKSQARPPFPLR